MNALDTLPKTRHLENAHGKLERLKSPYERVILDPKGKIKKARVMKGGDIIVGISDLGWNEGATFVSIYDMSRPSGKYYNSNVIPNLRLWTKVDDTVKQFNKLQGRDGEEVHFWSDLSLEQSYKEGRLVSPIIGYMVQGILHGVETFDIAGRELLMSYTTTSTYQIPSYELAESQNIYEKYELLTRQLSNSSTYIFNSLCVEVPPKGLTLSFFSSSPDMIKKNVLFSIKVGVLEQFITMIEQGEEQSSIDKLQSSWTKATDLISDTCLLLPFLMKLEEIDTKTLWIIYRMCQLGLGERIKGSLWLLDKLYKAHLLMQQNPVQ